MHNHNIVPQKRQTGTYTMNQKEVQNTNQLDAEVLVTVTGLSKKFCKDLKTSLWYGVKDLTANIFGTQTQTTLRPKEFWAVKDINFTLKRGECLGLIGHNGAGKSTLLKILNGLINPDEGQVIIKGKVGALIELGAGFNPILSGRENIYNNGAVLGFTKAEIDKKVAEIIAFSELQEFIDMPVQNYSSGMKVRLGFAIASQMQPDVLIIDEVLAVGDLGFVLKCFKTIDQLLPHTAVIFVSHSMPMVSRICNKIILMDRGKAKYTGTDVSKAIDLYYTRFDESKSTVVFDNGQGYIDKIEINDYSKSDEFPILNWKEDMRIKVYLKDYKKKYYPYVKIFVSDKEQRSAGMLYYKYEKKEYSPEKPITLVVKNIQFSKGIYSLSIILEEAFNSNPFYRVNSIKSFQIKHEIDSWSPMLIETNCEI